MLVVGQCKRPELFLFASYGKAHPLAIYVSRITGLNERHAFIAGHGTMGLEILEDAPDTVAVIASIGGGGLITGVGSAIKALKPEVKIWGVEPETAAPAALSFAKDSPQVFPDWKSLLHRFPICRTGEYEIAAASARCPVP